MSVSTVESRELAVRPMPDYVAQRVALALARVRSDQTMQAQRYLAAYGAYCSGELTWVKLAGRTETYLSHKRTNPKITPIRTGCQFDPCGIPGSANRQMRRMPPRVTRRRGTGPSRKIVKSSVYDVPATLRMFA